MFDLGFDGVLGVGEDAEAIDLIFFCGGLVEVGGDGGDVDFGTWVVTWRTVVFLGGHAEGISKKSDGKCWMRVKPDARLWWKRVSIVTVRRCQHKASFFPVRNALAVREPLFAAWHVDT